MKKPFNGWAEGAKFYGPVLAIGAALTVFFWGGGAVWTGYGILALGIAMALFFRDFPRTITAGPEEVVSPADGTVVAVERIEDSPFYDGPCTRISIFLSVFSVHVNRAPFACTVRDVAYVPGKFMNAMSADSSVVNEATTLRLDTARGAMTVRQIAGLVARRIVCPVTPGTSLSAGEKFGMIRFGSRTELYLPADAEVLVKPRQGVAGGLSVVARFP